MITIFVWGFIFGMAFEYFYQMRQADKHIRFASIEFDGRDLVLTPTDTDVSNNGDG